MTQHSADAMSFVHSDCVQIYLIPILRHQKIGKPELHCLGALIGAGSWADDGCLVSTAGRERFQRNREYTQSSKCSATRDSEDSFLSALQNQWKSSSSDDVRPLDIQLPRRPPIVDVGFGQGNPRFQSASVVHQHVQSLEVRLNVFDSLAHSSGIADIHSQLQELRLLAACLLCSFQNLFCYLVEVRPGKQGDSGGPCAC